MTGELAAAIRPAVARTAKHSSARIRIRVVFILNCIVCSPVLLLLVGFSRLLEVFGARLPMHPGECQSTCNLVRRQVDHRALNAGRRQGGNTEQRPRTAFRSVGPFIHAGF